MDKNECHVDLGNPGFTGTWESVGPTNALGIGGWREAEERPQRPWKLSSGVQVFVS